MNNNIAAYPCVNSSSKEHLQEGMTLLDYFAGQALQGISVMKAGNHEQDLHAREAYRVAKAMLEERKKYIEE